MILALDLATQTGTCAGNPDARPVLDHFRLPSTGTDVGLFLSAWEDWLRPQVREVGPSLIVFEAPILAGQTQIATTRKLQGMAGVTEMVAHRAGIECAEVATSQVKKALTGSGKADKAQMIAAAKAYGFDPKTSDEADAFGIWLCAVRLRHPPHAWRWEPLTAARTA